jgi:hypothetical protein
MKLFVYFMTYSYLCNIELKTNKYSNYNNTKN